MEKVILYIATSVDGFIADKTGSVDWLSSFTDPEDQCGYKALLERVSTIIMGSRSYEQIVGFGEWAWKDKQTYIFTSKIKTDVDSYITFVQESPKVFMNKLKSTKDIWLLGGAELAKSFAKEKLIDECIITIVPVTLGEGIKLELPMEDFDLVSEKSPLPGIIQKVYLKREE